MNRVAFLILLFFAISNSSNAQIKIYGKITGYDGKPTALAIVVEEKERGEFSQKAICDKDGNYSFDVEKSGIYTYFFAGTYHFDREVKFYVPENTKEFNIDVQLSPIVIADPSKLQIVGDFNKFDFQNGILPLELKDGRYSITLDNNSDTLKYQLAYDFPNRQGLRSFNGSNADYFIKDGGVDFISCIITKDKKVKIEFDSSAYSKEQTKSKLNSNNPETKKFINIFVENERLHNNFLYYSQQQMMKSNWDSMDIIKNQYVDKAIAAIDTESNKYIRAFKIINLFDIASYGQTMDKVNTKKLKKYAKEVVKVFDARSDWGSFYCAFFIAEAIENPFKSKFLQDMAANNPSESTRERTLYSLLSATRSDKYKKYQKEYFEKFKKLYPNGKNIKSVLREFNPEKNIEIGKTIPDFSLAKLENLNDTISATDLKGKYYLLDVWGTWCGPCRLEMPHLDSAYAMFKDKNFGILSIAFDLSPADVIEFRKGKWKMPWLHAFATGLYKNPIADIFQITGVPFIFLIDPNGKIIEDARSLRGERLIPTLQKYLK